MKILLLYVLKITLRQNKLLFKKKQKNKEMLPLVSFCIINTNEMNEIRERYQRNSLR